MSFHYYAGEDGGSAFPHATVHATGHVQRQDGLTIRDWFAGQAATGILIAETGAVFFAPEAVAARAYAIADAMVAARVALSPEAQP